ncbi:MAG: glucose-6-phosphate dehydrogenase [Emcibacteraceae bacterium]|nr:glucose-6-phosphate dehydrogenase [Emcibacteraceae bacterium]
MKLDFVIFGGVGDLSLRKLLPSLYYLFREGNLPIESRILCVSRADETPEAFKFKIKNKIIEFLDGDFDDEVWEKYQRILSYVKVDLYLTSDWQNLSDLLNISNTDKNRSVIYYLSVPPVLFSTVCQQINDLDLNTPFSQLVVEKPLGEDLKSAITINQLLNKSFDEKQIYRIDHYLGNPALQNIVKLRSEHPQLEAIWNKDFISKIDITISETVGVEGRAEFLDRVGALRDMVQNHLMQILCFTVMDLPKTDAADDTRDRKVDIVKALDVSERQAIRAQYISGQIEGHAVPGYLDELTPDMNKVDGSGETYVEVKTKINNDRWHGVPIHLKTGKRLSKRITEVVLHLRNGESKFIKVEIQPNVKFMTNMHNKEIAAIEMKLSTDKRIPEAYEFLIHEIIKGNQANFVRGDEIMASWTWIDGIREQWLNTDQEMLTYEAGSNGPVLE